MCSLRMPLFLFEYIKRKKKIIFMFIKISFYSFTSLFYTEFKRYLIKKINLRLAFLSANTLSLFLTHSTQFMRLDR